MTSAPPRELPKQLTSFIGRERELAELARLLSDARLLTIVGAPGSGKTRLALELARTLADRFPDGTSLIEFGPVSDPQLVPLEIATAIGITGGAREVPMNAITRHLSGARSLLIFDNCEHLIDACAEAAEAVLTTCPEVRVLATSREALQVSGELAWRAPSLGAAEAVQLFVERARLVDPAFKLTAENSADITQIVRRLDGIPLAIELAAARARVMSPLEIVEHLENRFELLTGGSRTSLPRQRTLRATVDWSYDLLDASERTIFRRLSVFSGGFSLDAAEHVCAGDGIAQPEVLDLTSRLATKSLLTTALQREGRMRYQLLETLRQYAQDRLFESGEAERIRDRHAEYFRRIAEATAPHLIGPDEALWMQRLEGDHDNFRAALQWLENRSPDALLDLAGNLARFWAAYGYGLERMRWLTTALRLSHSRVPTRASALQWLSDAAQRHGDYAEARRLTDELHDLAVELGDKNRMVFALLGQGRVALAEGDFVAAREKCQRALELSATADPRTQGMVKTDLGHVALAERDLPTARRLLEETVATLVAIGDRRAEGAVRDSLAAVALAEGHRDEARQHYLTILGIATELHDEPGFVNAVEGLATVAAEGGQWERALRLGAAAERLRDTLFFRRSMPFMRGTFEAAVARARRAMPEATATAVWNEGANMSREQLIAMALTGASRAPANIEPLSAREAEIAALVAEGRTNRQIADRLVIAERTVDAHVAHILDKLGFHSRSEIAAWAVRAGLGARSRPTAR